MKPKQFQRLVDRDSCCLHCGKTEAISPNHRINRGMGGSKILDRPSNIIVLCSEMNSLIESNWLYREVAIQYGWKLERWQIPEEAPVFDTRLWQWFRLDNDYNRVVVNKDELDKQKEIENTLD